MTDPVTDLRAPLDSGGLFWLHAPRLGGSAAHCKPENKVALGFVEGINNIRQPCGRLAALRVPSGGGSGADGPDAQRECFRRGLSFRGVPRRARFLNLSRYLREQYAAPG